MRRFLLLLCLSALVAAIWYWPNRPQNPPGGEPGEKFVSLSFGAFHPGESPLTERFPTPAEAESDMALAAQEAGAIRTYAAIGGNFDTAALAARHGLKLWQGIWLGGDRAKNALEMARGIAIAHQYPETVTRLVVGNEVLLRRDLPPAELIADIDQVRRAVRQPVAYADVWDFWKQFPEVAPHVDVMLIHLLPYWEDVPTGIDRAVAHVNDAYREMRTLFPGKQIAIGETGWPSRGRQRADAVPSRVNEAKFLRAFLTLSRQEHFDYNFIEAFDQDWKYQSEGTVGANWGVFDAQRRIKIPLDGPISEEPAWPWYAALSIGTGLLLALVSGSKDLSLAGVQGAAPPGLRVTAEAMSLGLATGFAAAMTLPTLYDIHLRLAAAVNLPAQAILAVLYMRARPGPARSARQSAAALRALVVRGRREPAGAAMQDIRFLFVWTASVLQLLLLFDPRYREFPLATFAVPVTITIWQLIRREVPPATWDRLDLLAPVTLVGGAVASAIQEGPWNGQSLIWNAAAVLLACPVLLAWGQARQGVTTQKAGR